ncbi:hypothetical protein PC9H_005327 [Pleurotus ostreatus]|uniref:Uncharacterized protein n=1 Tax=Pleurotus ostreatus TaxID=5322 RepID=A0A8H6ZWA1_PLEOS|nr:uncharacterized protein PC9H_005327 [Pleurotus ostreatus]KAF7433377.1 hypothetical protein PC9H_005327 [Pleurotus ostreatus]
MGYPFWARQSGDTALRSIFIALVVALCISLLVHHELRLLQSTIIGITVLRLLVVPGLSLLVAASRSTVSPTDRAHEYEHDRQARQGRGQHPSDGSRHDEEDNEEHQVHQTLLTVASLALVLPALFFAGLDKRAFNNLNLPSVVKCTQYYDNRRNRADLEHTRRAGLDKPGDSCHPSFHEPPSPLHPPASSPPPISIPLPSTSHAQHNHNLLFQPPYPITKEHEHPQRRPTVHVQPEPQINIAACILLILVSLISMCITTYFLVSAVHAMHTSSSSSLRSVRVQAELLALIVLPIICIAGDLLLYLFYFFQCIASALSCKFTSTTTTDTNTNITTTTHTYPSSHPTPPSSPSSRLALQLTTQFLLFWTPCFLFICSLISLATPRWGTPPSSLLLLFDVFEVGILLAAWLLASWCYCAGEDRGDGHGEGSWDSERRGQGVDVRKESRRVKRAQGALMIIFYVMIAITAWSYPGQPEFNRLLLSTTTSNSPNTRDGGAPSVTSFASTLEPLSVVQTHLPPTTATVLPLAPTQGTAREGDGDIEDDDDEFEDEEYVIGEDEDSEFDDRLVDVLRLLVHVV